MSWVGGDIVVVCGAFGTVRGCLDVDIVVVCGVFGIVRGCWKGLVLEVQIRTRGKRGPDIPVAMGVCCSEVRVMLAVVSKVSNHTTADCGLESSCRQTGLTARSSQLAIEHDEAPSSDSTSP